MNLLNFYLSTSFFKLLFEAFGFVFGYTFFQGFGSTVNQFLGFFQAQAGQVFYQLNYGQLGTASGFQDNVKRCLLLGSLGSSRTATATTGGSSRRGGLNAVLVFKDTSEFVYFFNGEANKLLSEGFQICHFCRLVKRGC